MQISKNLKKQSGKEVPRFYRFLQKPSFDTFLADQLGESSSYHENSQADRAIENRSYWIQGISKRVFPAENVNLKF